MVFVVCVLLYVKNNVQRECENWRSAQIVIDQFVKAPVRRNTATQKNLMIQPHLCSITANHVIERNRKNLICMQTDLNTII